MRPGQRLELRKDGVSVLMMLGRCEAEFAMAVNPQRQIVAAAATRVTGLFVFVPGGAESVECRRLQKLNQYRFIRILKERHIADACTCIIPFKIGVCDGEGFSSVLWGAERGALGLVPKNLELRAFHAWSTRFVRETNSP